jgi:hypothetical protein
MSLARGVTNSEVVIVKNSDDHIPDIDVIIDA